MTIRILLVDDHAVVRSGLSKFLLVNKDLELVGEACDGAEAVTMTSIYKPDVILMDLVMPGTDGITATREIHQKFPQVKVIALTSFSEQNMVQGALQAGATGYLQKNVTAAELGNAIRSVMVGRMSLSSEAAQALANSVIQPQIPGNAITDRERDVLQCVVEGLNNNEIADKLFISIGTVKFHISNIFQKLGVNSRVEAVKAAIEQKLVWNIRRNHPIGDSENHKYQITCITANMIDANLMPDLAFNECTGFWKATSEINIRDRDDNLQAQTPAYDGSDVCGPLDATLLDNWACCPANNHFYPGCLSDLAAQ